MPLSASKALRATGFGQAEFPELKVRFENSQLII